MRTGLLVLGVALLVACGDDTSVPRPSTPRDADMEDACISGACSDARVPDACSGPACGDAAPHDAACGDPSCGDAGTVDGGACDGACLPSAFTLRLTPGGLSPTFDANISQYTARVGMFVERVVLTATSPSQVDVRVNGESVALAVPWQSPVLNLGDNPIVVDVDQVGVPSRQYTLTVTRGYQEAYLKASHTTVIAEGVGTGDEFGLRAAISGDTLVVGAPNEGSGATGVNGDQLDDSALGAGAAYVFVRNGDTWTQQAYLKASNTDAGDGFGTSVAISGDTIVVGALNEASIATGVGGDQTNNEHTSAGAAYVFVRNAGVWTQQAYLKASNAGVADWFGASVSISGNTVVVGAPRESSDTTTINGADNDNALRSGAAYVFVRNVNSWSQQAYLKASNANTEDRFGDHVAIDGDRVVVGAIGESSAPNGQASAPGDNSAPYAGAAYVFARTGTSWSQQAFLKAQGGHAGDRFGSAVAISGDRLVVGASNESSFTTGVNGDGNNMNAPSSGAAYVFVQNAGAWSQQAFLKASNTASFDFFGDHVAIDGARILIGASWEASGSAGFDADPFDNRAANAGAVYVFIVEGITWRQLAYLKASNAGSDDYFASVALAGDTVVVGAPGEASAATGVNGDETDNSAFRAGAVYVLR